MTTYITLTLPDDYKKAKYKNLFAAYITPLVATHKGARGKCVTADGFTECEWAFDGPAAAKAARALNALFKRLEKESPSLLRTTGATSLPAKASVMPATYERTGARNIVRPDYHDAGVLKPNACRGFDKPLKPALRDGDAPPLPAADYCGARVRGNDGKMWVAAGKGKCQWAKA